MSKESLSFKATMISIGMFCASLSTLVAGMVMSRYFSVADYGIYRQVQLVYNTLLPLFVLGLPQSVNYFLPQFTEEKKRKEFVMQTYNILLGIGVLFFLLMFFGGDILSGISKSKEVSGYLRIFAFYPLFTLPTVFYQNLFVVTNKVRLSAVLSAALSLVNLSAILLTVLAKGQVALLLILVNVAALVQFLVVSYHTLKYCGGWWLRIDKWSLLEQFKYCIPLGIAMLVGALTRQTDKWLISIYFTPEEYAIYSNGAYELPFLPIIATSVSAVLMPELVRYFRDGKWEEMLRVWHNSCEKVGVIFFGVMAFLLFFTPEAIAFLFSDKYASSGQVFQIYLLILPTRITTFGMVLQAMGKSRKVLSVSVYTLIVNLILSLFTVRLFGFLGPTIATVTLFYLMGILQLQQIRSVLRVSFRRVFPWGKLGKIMGVALVAGLISYYMTHLIKFPVLVSLGLGGVVFGAAYAGLMYLVGYNVYGIVKPILLRR